MSNISQDNFGYASDMRMKNIYRKMRETRHLKLINSIFLLFLLAAGLVLFLSNLGNHYLWQDEAQTACISRTILTNGIPRGYDGKNFFSQENKAEYGKNYVWKWHTWLSFYLVAFFFKLFGINTFTARLPFALFGIGTLFMTYFFTRDLLESKKIAIIASLLLLISVSFLLLSRQCRYYSLSAFFSLWGLHSYLGVLKRKKYASAGFVFSSTLLFHTHFLYAATLLATIFFHALLFHRNKLIRFIFLTLTVVLINIPWIIWLSSMKYGQNYGRSMFSLQYLFLFTKSYIFQIGRSLFPPYLLLIIPLGIAKNWMKNKSFFPNDCSYWWPQLSLLFLFILITFVALVMSCPFPFFRYLAPLIPIFSIITALVLVSAWRIHYTLAILIVSILIFTGSLKEFCYEITHDYDGPIEGIAKYLNKHGQDDDIVAITYGDMPLKFYTSMRIVGGLTGEDLSLAKKARWLILRKYNICNKDAIVRRYLVQILNPKNFRRIVINYPDISFENREDPIKHQFRTVENEDRVIIFQKVK